MKLIRGIRYRVAMTTVLLISIISLLFSQTNDTIISWRQHETLTNRFASEWFRISVLKKELEKINQILQELRELEFLPLHLTSLNDDHIYAFDKAIEKSEKRGALSLKQLDKIAMPLTDAIAILQEMTIGEAINDMFTVLEDGDIIRLSQLLDEKHNIDTLWCDVNNIIESVSRDMNLTSLLQDKFISDEDDFVRILRMSFEDKFIHNYEKISKIIDQLISRGSSADISLMYKFEVRHLKNQIKNKQYDIVEDKLSLIKKRYLSRQNIYELELLDANATFLNGDFGRSLTLIDKLPDFPVFITQKTLLRIQSLYKLRDYSAIVAWAEEFDISQLFGENRNLVLWLILESRYQEGLDFENKNYFDLIESSSSYNLHILHTIGRFYLRSGKPDVAISILKKAINQNVTEKVDIIAQKEIVLTLAHVLYESGDYKNALNQFFTLLNDEQERFFRESLFGIAWCYINLKMYTKAETTMLKLINQVPDSPRAAETMIVMARRYIAKATYEWKKILWLQNEGVGLAHLINRLKMGLEKEKNEDKLIKLNMALDETQTMFDHINTEPRFSYNEINRLYSKALLISDLITTHYETGSFQEIRFSEAREKILHKLDSLLFVIKGTTQDCDNLSGLLRDDIDKIKTIVQNSYILITEININRYRYELAKLDREKKHLYNETKELEKLIVVESDSLKVDSLNDIVGAITNSIDSLVLVDNELCQFWNDTLIKSCETLLTMPLNSNDDIYLRYYLGELYYARENALFTLKYDEYEDKINRYDSLLIRFHDGKNGAMPIEPKQPILVHDQSMIQFKQAILNHPKGQFVDACRYSLAWCYNDLGYKDSAVSQMIIVANDSQNSQYAPQAWMYLGEHYFENTKLDESIRAYRSVLRYPESQWFDNALYKLAWTQYRLSNPEKAISSFLALVDLGKGSSTGKSLLENESLDYIAISFSESDIEGDKGLRKAMTFCRRLDDFDKGTKILHRLADVYEEQGRFSMARRSYESLLDMYPSYSLCPIVESKLINVKSRDISLEESCEYKMAFFKKYNFESEWSKKQHNTDVRRIADSTAESLLYDASITYHRLALEKNDSVVYAQTIRAYELYIHHYYESLQANECHYNLAEILFSTGNYLRAAQEYIAVSRRYPDSKYKETAAWNAIVASQTLMKNEKEKVQ